ncbi:DsbA family protein [Actinomycetospora termitidis]|uniref:Thioredoxin domain-containing protein n=1 Tax=Actinomycetospora termitidis TaxID=3053470 RepID=A0ABT7M974_9PSEU|nr:thioredoxin domain-containing protein [Actinomycetospora sp. Odt1-22]MDL5157221.1 thioredoxin domain-containing protein [Actinomycetospora sp. Odt1-22]
MAKQRARGRGSAPTVGRSRTPTIIAVVTLVVLIGVIAVAVISAQSNKNASLPVNQPVTPVNATYQTRVDGGAIVAGNGPTTIDVYEDALCPACKQFESVYGDRFVEALNANRVTVRYHMVNLLEQNSNPPGYSTLGGNALMCAAANGGFPTLHKTLYERQPEEGGAGYTVDDLVTLGQSAGVGPGYEACVRGNTYGAAVAQNYQQASSDPALQQTSGGSTGFGTPTITVDGRLVQANDPALSTALG